MLCFFWRLFFLHMCHIRTSKISQTHAYIGIVQSLTKTNIITTLIARYNDIHVCRVRHFWRWLIIRLPCLANWDQYHCKLIPRRYLFYGLMLRGEVQSFHPGEIIKTSYDIIKNEEVIRQDSTKINVHEFIKHNKILFERRMTGIGCDLMNCNVPVNGIVKCSMHLKYM